MTDDPSEAQQFADFLQNDPVMAEVTIEIAVVLDLLKTDRLTEATDRIEGWDADFTDTAVLMLSLALLGTLPQDRTEKADG